MNLRIIVVIIVTLLISTSSVHAQIPEKLPDFTGPNFQMPANTVNCFDYYTFGSVQADFSPSVTDVVAGTKINFSGELRNSNAYPVVEGKLIVKIFKIQGDQKQKNIFGPDVIDEFVAMENVVMQGKGSIPLNFTWTVPEHLASGAYKAVTFFTVGNRYNLLGLSFTDDVVGNSSDFKIIGKNKSVYFNKSAVLVDKIPYYFAAYPPRVDTVTSVPLQVEIVNELDTAQNIPIVWQIYAWDAQDQENKIVEYNQTVELGPKSKTIVAYEITDNAHPVYYVRVQASYKDAKSILGIRFVRREINTTRINFPSILKYPLQKGEEQTLFSCLHSVSDSAPTPIGTLKLKLEDNDGRIIHEYTYTGPVTGMMMGVADRFVPENTYQDFKLNAELYDEGGKLVESINLQYSCELIDPSACKKSSPKYMLWTVLLLLILATIFFTIKKRKGAVLCFLLVLAGVAQPHSVSAADVQWNQVLNRGFSYYYDRTFDSSLPANTVAGWHIGLLTPNVTVRYSAEVKNVDTNQVLSSGDSIQQGDRLDFTFQPHLSTDISWFGTGFSTDSPYGEWGSVSTPPAVSCLIKDFVNYDTSPPPLNFAIYIPLVIEAPVKQLTNTTGMSCVDLNSTTKRCTVTGQGNLNPTFSFAETTGKFFYRLKGVSYFGGRCVGNNLPLEVITSSTTTEPYSVVVPQQVISYSLTAIVNGHPPTDPVVTGPTTGYVGQTYTFDAVSTDQDSDDIRYGIDWTSGGTVNAWAPDPGYAVTGVSQAFTKSWATAGTYTFKVKAQDDTGADSAGWTTHTITISELDVCTNISSVQSAPLFEAHGRDYFYASGDGKLYFAPAGASSAAACTVDMCANTPAIEGAVPVGQSWNPSGADPYAQYSCNPPPTCSCNGTRTYSCTDGSSIPNAPQCALTAACTYTVSGNQVTFTYLATNVIGSLVNGQDNVQAIPANQAGVLSGTRTLSNTGDSQTAVAACGYTYDTTGLADPKILEFTSTPIVEKGGTCIFTWFTQDMTSCTLGGTDFGVNGTRGFTATAGTNISKTLSCTSNETTPRQFVQTKTCLVKPTVIEQ